MSLGVGTLATYQKKEPAGAPFPANSAYNGVSVDPNNGRIVLGDDGGGEADFISDRFIGSRGFLLDIYGTVGEFMLQECRAGLIGDASQSFLPTAYFQDRNQPGHSFEVFMDGNSAMGVVAYGDGVPRIAALQLTSARINVVTNIGTAAVTQALFEVTEGAIATQEPSPTGPGEWKLGKVVAAPVALDNTRYVEVQIDGNVVRLAVVT
jgi:hypothetical protein